MNPLHMVYDPTPNPLRAFRFRVYIGPMLMGFSKITGIENSVETETLQVGGINDRVYSLRKPVFAEKTMTFERGVAARGVGALVGTLRFHPGQRIPTDIIITICNHMGLPVEAIVVGGAFVKKCTLSELDAMSDQVLIEQFEVSYEDIDRIPIPGTSVVT